MIRLGEKINSRDWTVFINYNHNFPRNDRDKAEVLFTSMEAPWSYSGFFVGINGANRLFFEYAAGNKTKKVLTLPKELEQYEIISVSKSNTAI